MKEIDMAQTQTITAETTIESLKSRLQKTWMLGDYDRFYQNYVPGAVTPDKIKVALSSYNNDTKRKNLFNLC